MKTLCLIIVFLFSLICFDLKAQSRIDSSIDQMMAETEKQIVSIENEIYTISRVEIGLTKFSEPTFSQVQLVGGRTYNFYLQGEHDKIKDIDLKIYQKELDELVEIKHENSISNIIKTSFKPEKTDYYEIEILATGNYSTISEGRYSLIISSF